MDVETLTKHGAMRIAQRGIRDVELIELIGTEVDDGILVRAKDCAAAERQIKSLQADVARLKAQLQERQGPKREVRRTVRREGEEGQARTRAERRPTERELALKQLEVMRMAHPALREGERREAAMGG